MKWIGKGNLETVVSAHDIGDHPDYTFWRCTIVVRLTDVVTSEINQPGDIQGNTSCGQVGYNSIYIYIYIYIYI